MKVYTRVVGMLLVVLFCSGNSADIDFIRSQRIKTRIMEHGLYEKVKDGEKYLAPETTSGKGEAGVVNRHINTTTEVPLTKGVIFGFQWEASGFIEDEVNIVFRISHPVIKKPDGTESTGCEERFPITAHAGVIKSTDYYVLSEDFELAEGDWTISVVYENEVLAAKTFHVRRTVGATVK